MTQNFPTSAQIIYNTLANDSEFMSLIGDYVFKTGQTDKAISIVTPGQDLPSLASVTGVECIVQDTGDIVQQKYYGSVDLVTTWNLFLIVWEPSTGADLQGATERVLSRFLNSRALQVVSTTDGLGSLVQNKISIDSNMPILEG